MRYKIHQLEQFTQNEVQLEHLRFLAGNGDIYASPENHVHSEVLREEQLSNKPDFEGIIEVCQNGYALLCPSSGQLLVSYMKNLTEAQETAVKRLTEIFNCETILNYEECF